jgi:Flp pilus assembly protein TadD
VAFTQEGRPAEAIQNYEEAVKLSPDYVTALNNLAWLLATCPQPELRDGPQAVVYAERACAVTHYQVPFLMGTLAIAYAEAGRFPDAIATAQKVQTLATQDGLTAFAQQVSQLTRMFQAHRAYHERSLHKTSP